MSIIVPDTLPAAQILREEGYNVNPPDSTPVISIGLVNLMPLKEETELDFMRLIAPYRSAVRMTLISMANHKSRHTSAEHILKHYVKSTEINPNEFDGVIVTGAPLEFVAMHDIDYIDEIQHLFSTLHDLRIPALYICWAAFAAALHLYQTPFHLTREKISGIFTHSIGDNESKLLKGIDNNFFMPHSRFAYWKGNEISPALTIAASSQAAGTTILTNDQYREYFICGHGEYRLETLGNEYQRDLKKGLNPAIPVNYFPDDDPTKTPINRWHKTELTIMHNWLGIVGEKR